MSHFSSHIYLAFIKIRCNVFFFIEITGFFLEMLCFYFIQPIRKEWFYPILNPIRPMNWFRWAHCYPISVPVENCVQCYYCRNLSIFGSTTNFNYGDRLWDELQLVNCSIFELKHFLAITHEGGEEEKSEGQNLNWKTRKTTKENGEQQFRSSLSRWPFWNLVNLFNNHL